MISGVLFFVGLTAASAKRGQCYLSGDPHVRSFDRPHGWTHHPIYAPGAWYLVHTESGEFTAQGMYSQCGRRTGGGWQRRWQHNTSAHCLESMALGGSIMGDKSLVIQPPCLWNWGEMTCDSCTADKLPRFTYNGKQIDCTNNQWLTVAEGVQVHCRHNRAQAKINVAGKGEVTMAMNFWGGRGFEHGTAKCTAGTHSSMHLWMNQGDFGSQCGHCGNFDGNYGDDNEYIGSTGSTNPDAPSLCAAEVQDCNHLFNLAHVPKQYNSNGYVIPEDDSMCGCARENQCQEQGETRLNVVQACQDSYEQVCRSQADPNDQKHADFFEECVSDTCNGGKAFTEVDVEDEAWAVCTETQSLHDDAVCAHCVAQ